MEGILILKQYNERTFTFFSNLAYLLLKNTSKGISDFKYPV
ncbi:Hypothetical protein I595_435 [Croceitalea dokdonensis DOKDO 023]|uniref:Uncharacterized protein n=1 Tax=Croceitalea dokdonensis DOKDO 023 TaxID=1300341 RepID=A0A0N8H4J3_9FLAO|nr:Hypothetical protein I595_435 [Croceitalea dokdonensis DOKDO 023]